MAGASTEEIAAIERVPYNTVQVRLARARRLFIENLADDPSVLLGPWDDAGGIELGPARGGELR